MERTREQNQRSIEKEKNLIETRCKAKKEYTNYCYHQSESVFSSKAPILRSINQRSFCVYLCRYSKANAQYIAYRHNKKISAHYLSFFICHSMLLSYTTAKTSELLFTRLLSSHFSGAAVSATLFIAQHTLFRYIYSACFILFFYYYYYYQTVCIYRLSKFKFFQRTTSQTTAENTRR